MRRAYALVFVLISGCVWTEERPTLKLPPPEQPPPPEPPAPPPLPPPAEPQGAVITQPPAEPAAPLPTPSIQVEEAKGLTTDEANALFAQAKEALAECGSTAGVLRLRVTADGARTLFKIDPSSTMDHRARECALEALSISEIDEAIEASKSPDERKLRMNSLVVISWPE